ncbi:MAG: VOC family protein [Actinobacteria bacterium]|nr:VOC family protein [Actinomycetota bacterium]
MTARNFFHVGILVPDMREAMARFSDVLRLDFMEPAVAHVDDFDDAGGRRVLDLNITWARQGPPYVELLEAQDEGLYGTANLGLHHVGLYDPDCEGLIEELVGKGLRREATQWTPEGRIIAVYTAPEEMHGTRLEFIDQSREAGMNAWLRGETWTD